MLRVRVLAASSTHFPAYGRMEVITSIFNYFWALPAMVKILIVSLIVMDVAFSTLYGITGKYKKLYKLVFPKQKKQYKKSGGKNSYKAGKAN
ncbi:unnamed protein product, partial [Mesorhabditis spiculigera]